MSSPEVVVDPRDRGGPAQPLLIVRELRKCFPARPGVHGAPARAVRAVDGISFSVDKGETLGVVGESGCGKSTLARLLMHLVTKDAGELVLDGEAVGEVRGLPLRELRKQMQIVFQDSHSSLNPRLPVVESIAYGPRVQGMARGEAARCARMLLEQVGLDPATFAGRYPHELSGGQKQRVNIARALALSPRLLILDEAVSALDKTIEAQVLAILRELKARLRLTYLFISHDLNVVRHVADRVLVMYCGRIVEIGPVDAIYREPRHPYTAALLACRLGLDPRRRMEVAPLAGDPPSPVDPPAGCHFHTRCPMVEDICRRVAPELGPVSAAGTGTHLAACHRTRPESASFQPRGARIPILPVEIGAAVAAAVPREATAGAAPACDGGPARSGVIVDVRNLHVTFVNGSRRVEAVRGVTFDVSRGEVLCVIGESGSGKSAMMRALLRLHPGNRSSIEGHIVIDGRDIMAASETDLREVRGPVVSMIFQEPMTALDPIYTIGDQIAETVMQHDGCSRREARQRAVELLDVVRIPSPGRRVDTYPHELSGGLRQRAMIAVALSCRPRVLLADEPTTALDASVQIQILMLLRRLQRELGMSMIFVTHDLGVAAQVADRVAVMQNGRIVEIGDVENVMLRPRDPCTIGMMSAPSLRLPVIHAGTRPSSDTAAPSGAHPPLSPTSA